jgi:polysaccharide biosynthesis transport protein
MRLRSRQRVLAEIPERRPGSRPGTLSRGELEAFDRLAEALVGSKIVLTTGPTGSAVALGLAAVSTVRGKRVALVECDLAEPVLAETLGVSPAPGLHEYIRDEAKPGEILQPLVPAGPASGGASEHLTCIVAGSPASAAGALLGSERCRHAVEMLRRAYELIVLDGPPLGGDPNSVEALAAVADTTLVCGRRRELPRHPPLPGAELVVAA